MHKCILLFSFSLLTFHISTAQNTASTSRAPEPVYMTNPVQVSVDNDAPVENLLVVISDSTGQTIFLDNRFHLVGPYVRSIDLSRSGRGPYSLCIAKDEQRSFTRFYIK